MHAMYLSEPNLTIIALKQIQFNLEQFFYEMKLEVFFFNHSMSHKRRQILVC